MDQAEWKLLKEIADLEKTPQGAYNIRRNGQLDSRNNTANIEITTKTEPVSYTHLDVYKRQVLFPSKIIHPLRRDSRHILSYHRSTLQ